MEYSIHTFDIPISSIIFKLRGILKVSSISDSSAGSLIIIFGGLSFLAIKLN